ncbi:hypothetical protein CVT24_010376 [Panaeolus cyanescens]|uniref:Uncharacterized protein n=1 Tax=Panaeolus cyanescens TaxID=181874 RepID=A0A409X2M2_9AGAR|nr:hypothetical protein CVT24_010376 [Panaeolus cyanescens]
MASSNYQSFSSDAMENASDLPIPVVPTNTPNSHSCPIHHVQVAQNSPPKHKKKRAAPTHNMARLYGAKIFTDDDIKEWDDAEDVSQAYFNDKARKAPLSTLLALQDARYISEGQVAEILEKRLHDLTEKPFLLPASVIFRFLHIFNAKLSGSVIIRLIHPEDNFEPDDLDFYIEAMYERDAIKYLEKRGYQVSPPLYDKTRHTSSHSQTNYSYPHSTSYHRLYRFRVPETHGGKSINLVVSVGKAILPILCFHSSAVMNYLAHHGLFILYPKTTLHHIAIPNTPGTISDMSPRAQQGVLKYQNRGWTYRYARDLPHDCGKHPYCPRMLRSIHDSAVLRVPTPNYASQPVKVLYPAYQQDAQQGTWLLAGAGQCLQPSSESNCGYATVEGKTVPATEDKNKNAAYNRF